MPVLRTYECPDCEGRFEYLHMRAVHEPPAFCPLCGASTSTVQPELSAPHIARSIGAVADNVYRQMETASANRAEMAAEALGESVSEMSAMKVTNIRDDARPGETSAVSVNNPVSQFMGSTGIGGLQSSSSGAEYARATRGVQGSQGAGLQAMQSIRQNHNQVASQVARNGQQGRFSE